MQNSFFIKAKLYKKRSRKYSLFIFSELAPCKQGKGLRNCSGRLAWNLSESWKNRAIYYLWEYSDLPQKRKLDMERRNKELSELLKKH